MSIFFFDPYQVSLAAESIILPLFALDIIYPRYF